jgi:hypothetical protein
MLPARIVEAEWPDRMEVNQSDYIRISLVRTTDGQYEPTIEVGDHTVLTATQVPIGTPGPIEGIRGPEYRAFVVAHLDAAAFKCKPSVDREYELLEQPRIDWRWDCITDQPGDHRITASIEIWWKPVGDVGEAVGPCPVWSAPREISVETPWLGKNQLATFTRFSGIIGPLFSAPWLYERLRKRLHKRATYHATSEPLTELREILATRFDESELRTLCYELCEDYENLPPEGKAGKARELIRYLERRDRIPELVETGKRLRPGISWPEVASDE